MCPPRSVQLALAPVHRCSLLRARPLLPARSLPRPWSSQQACLRLLLWASPQRQPPRHLTPASLPHPKAFP
ncbi:MAG: hypothetical protein JO293_05915 [Candidatus Eremiobacteraeota bacterium]|nr:hypothetical protein [Candidatus Eremiobacteraeota bacterium]